MTFRALPEHLHDLAETALRHFGREHGIPVSRFKVEAELSSDIGYRPTFHASRPDHSLIGVEISDEPWPAAIQTLVLGCKNNFIPLRLWVVVPLGAVESIKASDMHLLRENGIGLLAMHNDGRRRELTSAPLALSLTGLRAVKVSDFPARYRGDLRTAYDTFVSGDPSKGCSRVYDEIESLTRRILKKANTKGFIRRPIGFDPDTESWSNVLAFLKANFDRTAAACPGLSETLLSRIQGLTEYRNEAGHKPKSLRRLIERDRKLRTRFESAIDELQALVDASKALRP